MVELPGDRGFHPAFKILLTVAFLAAGGLYVYARWDEFVALEWPSLFAIVVVATVFVINIGLRAVYNLVTARRLGTHLTLAESFMLSAVVAAGNLVLPVKAGAGIRALYMKKVHGFPISYFASGGLIFLVVTLVVVSLAAVGLLVAIYYSAGYFRLDLTILFPVVMVSSIGGLLLLRSKNDESSSGQNTWFESFRSSMSTVLGEPKLLATAVVIVCLIFAASSLAWAIALREYAPGIGLAEAFLLSASQIVAGFITLTPGATGFQEVAGLYVGRSFSATTTEIFAVLVWVRVVRTLVAIAVALPSGIILRGTLQAAGRVARQPVGNSPESDA